MEDFLDLMAQPYLYRFETSDHKDIHTIVKNNGKVAEKTRAASKTVVINSAPIISGTLGASVPPPPAEGGGPSLRRTSTFAQ